MKQIILYIVFLSICSTALGQEKIHVQYRFEGKSTPPKGVSLKKDFNTNYEITLHLRLITKELHQYGYLGASLDSITGDSLNKTAHLFIGQKFEWVDLKTDSIDEEILSRTGFRDKLFLDRPFNPKDISSFFERTLTYLENTGYPFAEIRLDDVQIIDSKIQATVLLNKNKYYAIDTIEIIGEPIKLSQNYIENIIRIKSNQAYEERLVARIGNRIKENPFVDELLPYEVIFTENSCKIVLTLKPKKASQFNGIIGLQPQEDNQGVVFTGDIKISIGNIIGQGERLNLRWQRLQDQTQEINTSFDIPFLFKTPLGFGYSLDIYRKDTSYNNVEQQFNIPFTLYNGSRFIGYYNTFRTNLISTSIYEGATEIPPFNDASNNTYGVQYLGAFVENSYNPYQGWLIDVKGGAGKNKLIPNPNLETVVYDSAVLESNLINSELSVSFFQPITKQTTLLLKGIGALKISENLVENQLYRIGGLNTLRGFDEQSIFASSYAIGTLEYRLILDEYSRVFVFSDVGWYERQIISGFGSDLLYGFGAGITFQTNVGMFSLNYALGGSSNQAINFRTGKIHFGFVNFF